MHRVPFTAPLCRVLGHRPMCDHRVEKIEAGLLPAEGFCDIDCGRCKRCSRRLAWDGSAWVVAEDDRG